MYEPSRTSQSIMARKILKKVIQKNFIQTKSKTGTKPLAGMKRTNVILRRHSQSNGFGFTTSLTVYFNHAQHVDVAGIDCQKCHGPVEEMEIMYQHSPLTMGWCIDCHRESNVDLENNEYCEKVHAELSKNM